VATCHELDLDHALADVRRDLIRQIEEEAAARPASAGRPVIARLDPGPGFDGALYHDPAVVPVGGSVTNRGVHSRGCPGRTLSQWSGVLPVGSRTPTRLGFCQSCGSPLVRAAAPEERKVVSILFVDLVEFTSRSDQADRPGGCAGHARALPHQGQVRD
jgi:hypothetical protein